MRYNKSSGISGTWLKSADVSTGTKAKLKSETTPQPSEYGTQDVAKASIQGKTELLNVRLNKPTINALIDAYGDDSTAWIDKVLIIHKEDMRVGGKKVTAMYFVPEGYELRDDEGGYLVIGKIGDPVKEGDGLVNPDDIPF